MPPGLQGMKEAQKHANDFPAYLIFFLVLFTSVISSLKRIEEWYQQITNDDNNTLSSRTLNLATFAQNIPPSMQPQCMVFILLVLYGILTKNDLVLIFSTINILAVFAGVAVTHAEYCENIRNF